MGEEKFSLGSGRVFMTPVDGEPGEYVEVKDIETFVDPEPEEIVDEDLSEHIAPSDKSPGDILMNAVAPGFEWSCKISIGAKAADRIFLRSFGWNNSGPVRKKGLLKCLKMEARSLMNNWSPEAADRYMDHVYAYKMLCDYKPMTKRLLKK